MDELKTVLSVGLVLVALVALIGGFHNRLAGDKPKGIGWQFIRFMVMAVALPLIALLALNDALSGEAAALIGGAMGYAFGKSEDPPATTSKTG